MAGSVVGNTKRVTCLVVLLVAAIASLASCGDRTVLRVSEEELDERVESLTRLDVPLYWAGRSVSGLPLTDAVSGGPGRATFFYGTCELPDSEGGCGPPIQIQQFPFELRDWRAAAGCERRPTTRGVPAVHHDTLVLFTGDRVVKIYAANPRRVAAALRPLRRGTPGTPLPRPPARIVRELGRVCR